MKISKRQKGLAAIKLQAERNQRHGGSMGMSRRQVEQGYVPVTGTRAHVEQVVEERARTAIEAFETRKARERAMTPDEAHSNGTSYQGDNLETKGKRDGNCNRTACQRSLADHPRWSMKDHMTGGRLYYCQRCVDLFHESDRQFGQPLRCTIIEEDR
jgi:hypothetical protein